MIRKALIKLDLAASVLVLATACIVEATPINYRLAVAEVEPPGIITYDTGFRFAYSVFAQDFDSELLGYYVPI